MSRPADIPQDVWAAAESALDLVLCNCRKSSGTSDQLRIDSITPIARVIIAAKAEEREACAEIAQARYPLLVPEGRKRPYVSTQIAHAAGLGIAAAIRKRGEA